MAVPHVRIHVAFPFVDVAHLLGARTPLDGHVNARSLQIPGERPFVRDVGEVAPATGMWGRLPGAPRSEVDVRRLLAFSTNDNLATSGVLRANVLRRCLIAETDGISGVVLMEFAWTSRKGAVRVELQTLVDAVEKLELDMDGTHVSGVKVRKAIESALGSRLHRQDPSRGIRTSRPLLLIEGTASALASHGVVPSQKLSLGAHGNLYALTHARWDLFLLMRGRQLARHDPISPALMLIQGLSGAIATLAGEPPSPALRRGLMSRVRTVEGMGSDGVKAGWSGKLLRFYDVAQHNALSAAIGRIAQDDEQLREKAGNAGMTFNNFGDINTQGGDFLAGVNVTKQTAQGDDNAALIKALEIIAQSNAANEAQVKLLLASAREGKDKSSLRTLWENAKGALQLVPTAVPAIEAVKGLLS